MEKKNKIYEGKAKIVYETDSPDHVIQYFKDYRHHLIAQRIETRRKGNIPDRDMSAFAKNTTRLLHSLEDIKNNKTIPEAEAKFLLRFLEELRNDSIIL